MAGSNGKVTVAVVGLVFGRYIVEDQLLNGPGRDYVDLVGVCDLNQDLGAKMAARHGLRQYPGLDDILADPAIEAVGLFNGPAGRAELIRRIIRAGKHVVTTKPFELDPVAALEVLRDARELGRIVHLNSPSPLPAPETRQIMDWTRDYDLGRPVSVHWETYANYFDQADGSWYDDPQRCPVAPIFRLGIYGINLIIGLCGAVEQVNVVSTRLRTGRPTADNALLSLKFRNGAVGSIHASFCVKNGYPYPHNLTMNYERGTIRTTATATDQYGTCARKVSLQFCGGNDPAIIREACFTRDELMGSYQWKHFHQAVRSGSPLPGEIRPEQVAAAVQVINAMTVAERTGQTVVLPELPG